MAYTSKFNKSTARSNNSNKPNAYLNLSVVDKNGNEHPFKYGIPLSEDGRLIERMVLEKAARAAELGEPLELTLTYRVQFTSDEETIDI